ncbi:hypothetical protein ACFL6S_08710 [Candidatus Poribacteria bacterium]
MRLRTRDYGLEIGDYRPETIVLCLVFCILCLAPSAYANLDMHILPGFDGYHKNGRWLPLRITLTSVDEDMTGEIAVEIQDSATGNRQIYSIPVTLSRAAGKMQYLYVLPESFRRNLRVKLIDDSGKTTLQKDASLVTIPPEDTLIVVVSRSGSGLEFLADIPEQDASLTEETDSETARTYVSYSTAELLPDKWKGYDSVDMIVLGDISASALSADQRQAITDWVYDGGRLIVSGGAHSQALMGTFIERLLPVRISGTRVLDSISSLSPQFGGTQVVVASSELADDGKAIAMENDGLPIIAEKEAHNGKVIFLAFDYLDPAFRAWDGKEKMWETLLPQPEIRKRHKDAIIARLLSTKGSMRLPSYKLVGIFLLLYVLCFGPLNYLILRKTGKSRLTWITMPLISAVFLIGSLVFAYTARGGALIVNDLSVVDVYQNSGRVRMSSYFSLLSPVSSDYTIEFPGLDGIFVNRIQSGIKKNQNGDCRLVEKESFQMEILNTDTVLPQLFYGESYADLVGNVSMKLNEDAEGVIQGEVTNHLPFDLTDCYVLSDGRRFCMGDLTRGNSAQVRLDQTYTGNIPGLYSTRGEEKQRLINAMKLNLSRSVSGTGIIGWMDGSALETLAKMSTVEEYEALGIVLIIVHL